MIKAYPAFFHAENGGYWAEFPDLPGCFAQGESIEQAVAETSDALGAYLASEMERGVSFAAPGDIRRMHADGNDFVSIVTAGPAAYQKRTKAIKKTLTIPEWLNDAAEARHINFSSVLQQALIQQLQ